jgi:hypothetical protein
MTRSLSREETQRSLSSDLPAILLLDDTLREEGGQINATLVRDTNAEEILCQENLCTSNKKDKKIYLGVLEGCLHLLIALIAARSLLRNPNRMIASNSPPLPLFSASLYKAVPREASCSALLVTKSEQRKRTNSQRISSQHFQSRCCLEVMAITILRESSSGAMRA